MDKRYPEEIKIDTARRVLHWHDRRAVRAVPIVNLEDAPPRCIQVTTAAGRIVRLPRNQCQFAPGVVVIPLWLYCKIFNNGVPVLMQRGASNAATAG